MTFYYNRETEKAKRRELRSNMPKAEVLLWTKLKGRQLLGFKFRRQYSIGPYVMDFYCPALKLGIELDGDSHFREGAKQRDRQRDVFIESFGVRIVRFWNCDVYENMDELLEALADEIRRRVAELKNPPCPPL